MKTIKIAVVAPACFLDPALAEKVQSLATRLFPRDRLSLHIHPQCFLSEGHFAGSDQVRAEAFLEVANDPTVNAVWFARGGYGSARLLPQVMDRLNQSARTKSYLGYSDVGSLLGALHARGIGHPVHGPMPADIRRENGQEAVRRALGYLVECDPAALEPSLEMDGRPAVAFNITILSHLMGTPWMPDLSGHVVMLEEVSEPHYRIDRAMCQLVTNPGFRRVAGLRLGRCSDIPPNTPDFGQDEEQIVRHWCEVSGIPWLGRAEIGHDTANRVVPFGPAITP